MGLFDPKQVSTQDHLDIEDIRDDLVVLRNGKVSLVLETTSLNFDLLSGREQDSRILTFAGLLNSLTFPIQIVISTQRTDSSKYMALLEEYKAKTINQALQSQVDIYQQFIGNLTQTTQILNKRFLAIIPTSTLLTVESSAIKQLLGKPKVVINSAEILERAKRELYPKRDHMIKQFNNMGLAARQLQNDELIKLYYAYYEPDKMGLEVLNIREEAIVNAAVGETSTEPVADMAPAPTEFQSPAQVSSVAQASKALQQ